MCYTGRKGCREDQTLSRRRVNEEFTHNLRTSRDVAGGNHGEVRFGEEEA